MKRSEINEIVRDADRFMQSHGFYLPAFAYWTPKDWQNKGEDAREVADHALGWDITDFGKGRYRELGLFMFTIRNGSLDALKAGRGKAYCEKALISDAEQITPMHFHWQKTEDIINRGGGRLIVEVYNVTPDEGLADTDVTVSVDGVRRVVQAGGRVTLKPGESITLLDHTYHTFWAEGSRCLLGEVSLVNDDKTDNRFFEPIGRFPDIQEDEPPLHLLVNDYPKYYRYAQR